MRAIINECLPRVAGLNDAARRLVAAKNTPAALYTELSSFFTLVCELPGGVVGVGALDGGEVKRLYVTPSVQGTGIGARLLTALEDEAKRREVNILQGAAAPSSLSFFERAGFTSTGEHRFCRGDAEFTVVGIEKALFPMRNTGVREQSSPASGSGSQRP